MEKMPFLSVLALGTALQAGCTPLPSALDRSHLIDVIGQANADYTEGNTIRKLDEGLGKVEAQACVQGKPAMTVFYKPSYLYATQDPAHSKPFPELLQLNDTTQGTGRVQVLFVCEQPDGLHYLWGDCHGADLPRDPYEKFRTETPIVEALQCRTLSFSTVEGSVSLPDVHLVRKSPLETQK